MIEINFISLDLATKVLGCAIFKNNTMVEYYRIENKGEDIYDRMVNMVNEIEKIIKIRQLKLAVIEEVPISKNTMNYDIARKLCCLQGIFIKMFKENGVKFRTVVPSEWRKTVGLNRSNFTCKKCGEVFEEQTNIEKKECRKCGNVTQSAFLSKNLNDRQSLKQRAVDYVNQIYNLKLEYFKNETKTKISNDNECEAIMLGRAFIKIIENEENIDV
ncbi:MAG: hypothetical protein RR322_04200 [Oscillospiraceae bacterium]